MMALKFFRMTSMLRIVIILSLIGLSLNLRAEERLAQYPELVKLQAFDPTLMIDIPKSLAEGDMFPTPNQLNILFTALRYCQNDLTQMQREFPDLTAIFVPQVIDDLDNDGELEVVMNLSGYEGDSTWIWIAEPHEKAFRYVEYKEECPLVTEIRVTHDYKVLLRRPGSKNIPKQGTNDLVTIEFVYQTMLKYTGEVIEVLHSCETIEESLVQE